MVSKCPSTHPGKLIFTCLSITMSRPSSMYEVDFSQVNSAGAAVRAEAAARAAEELAKEMVAAPAAAAASPKGWLKKAASLARKASQWFTRKGRNAHSLFLGSGNTRTRLGKGFNYLKGKGSNLHNYMLGKAEKRTRLGQGVNRLHRFTLGSGKNRTRLGAMLNKLKARLGYKMEEPAAI